MLFVVPDWRIISLALVKSPLDILSQAESMTDLVALLWLVKKISECREGSAMAIKLVHEHMAAKNTMNIGQDKNDL
jgi:hypothetical protein